MVTLDVPHFFRVFGGPRGLLDLLDRHVLSLNIVPILSPGWLDIDLIEVVGGFAGIAMRTNGSEVGGQSGDFCQVERTTFEK